MIFQNMTNSQILLLIIFPIGCLVGVIWWGAVIYLKYKWLSFVEETIDENFYSFSSNIFSAGLGVSRYALIFQFDWQAKRCDKLNKRELIPKKVQRLFIISNYLWLVASFIVFGSLMLYKVYLT